MCEFCVKHGEGEKWYLQAKNYSEDLLSDIRRTRFIERFRFKNSKSEFAKMSKGLARLDRLPWLLRSLFSRMITRKQKKVHFGQVVPIEDVERIFEFTNSIARFACICRKSLMGLEKRYCYGISLGLNGGQLLSLFRSLAQKYADGVGDNRFEMLTRAEALDSFRAYEHEGLCHTVWTLYTPSLDPSATVTVSIVWRCAPRSPMRFLSCFGVNMLPASMPASAPDAGNACGFASLVRSPTVRRAKRPSWIRIGATAAESAAPRAKRVQFGFTTASHHRLPPICGESSAKG